MNDAPERMAGTSLDMAAANRARLKALFPSVFTETVNDKGELVESVDLEKLKAELGTFTDLFEARRERYGMDWPGKKDALRLIQTPSAATLKPCREESVNFDTTENLFIEGDNLEVLKLLQKCYYGKVKMIYIDPPYNTGKEFIYPDNYSESLETYLEYAGLINSEGKKFSTNSPTEGRFHTRWLNMMYPRLYLARNLMRDDGVIFISIDDNEVSNLRDICDEIFGGENFIACFVWQSKKGGGSDAGTVVQDHEYVLVYAKDENTSDLAKITISAEELDRTDEKGSYRRGRELNKWGANSRREDRPTMWFPIPGPNGIDVFPIRNDGKEGCWRWGKKKMIAISQSNDIEFVKRDDGTYIAYEKIRSTDPRFKPYRTFLADTKTTADGSKEVKILFDGRKVFDFAKPTELLKTLIEVGFPNNDDIILDFFSGSAATAHAVLDLNKQDGGTRKFIMVQLPEPCAEGSEAFKAGYKTIADIGKERIRRVIRKLNEEDTGDLPYESASASDRGFKVLTLDKSNFKQWQQIAPDTAPKAIEHKLFDHIDHIDHEATPEDLLFEILIKAGFKPTEKVQAITLAGIPVYSIADGGLLICLADTVTEELINAVAEAEPMQFICLDKAFGGNDQLKANAVQTFNARNMGREKANQIVFRTV